MFAALVCLIYVGESQEVQLNTGVCNLQLHLAGIKRYTRFFILQLSWLHGYGSNASYSPSVCYGQQKSGVYVLETPEQDKVCVIRWGLNP